MNIEALIAFTDRLKLNYQSQRAQNHMNIAELITFTDTLKLKHQSWSTQIDERSSPF